MSDFAMDVQRGTNAGAPDAAGRAKQAAATASDEAAGVAQTAKDQVHEVVGEAKQQSRNLFEDAKSQLHGQATTQVSTLASSMRSMTQGLQALSEGRPEDAKAAGDFVHQAAQKLDELTTRLETRGFDGVTTDLARFARRRPGAFLTGAVVAGFLAGRLFRSTKDADGEADEMYRSEPMRQPMLTTPSPLHSPSAELLAPTSEPAAPRHTALTTADRLPSSQTSELPGRRESQR